MKSTFFIFTIVVSLLFIFSTKLEAMELFKIAKRIKFSQIFKTCQTTCLFKPFQADTNSKDPQHLTKQDFERIKNLAEKYSANRNRIFDKDQKPGEHQSLSQDQMQKLKSMKKLLCDPQSINSSSLNNHSQAKFFSEVLTETDADS